MIATLTRYLRLYACFVRFSFSRSFEFRFDFFMRILMDVIYYAVAISFFRILFLHTPLLGGWSEPQLMIFVAAYCMVDAIIMTIVSNNSWTFPQLVNRGDLDYYLLRPVSSLFFVSLRDFAASSFFNLIITGCLLTWAIARYPEPIALYKTAIFVLMIFNGAFLFYCLVMIANMVVFFTQAGQGFGNLLWGMSKLGERPDRIYKGWLRRIVTTLLPFSVMSSFPTRILIEDFDWEILLHTFAVSAAFFSLLLWLWNRGLRSYSSASS